MKVDKEILNIILQTTRNTIKIYQRRISISLKAMEKAETVEQVMEIKQTILREILFMFPLGRIHCYFCIKYPKECNKCEYAKFHGKCGQYSSDYTKLLKALDNLDKAIKEYYKGELYNNIEKGNKKLSKIKVRRNKK